MTRPASEALKEAFSKGAMFSHVGGAGASNADAALLKAELRMPSRRTASAEERRDVRANSLALLQAGGSAASTAAPRMHRPAARSTSQGPRAGADRGAVAPRLHPAGRSISPSRRSESPLGPAAIAPRRPPQMMELDWRATLPPQLEMAPAPPPDHPNQQQQQQQIRRPMTMSRKMRQQHQELLAGRQPQPEPENEPAPGRADWSVPRDTHRSVRMEAGASLLIQTEGLCLRVEVGEDGKVDVHAVPPGGEGNGGRSTGGRQPNAVTATIQPCDG
jgi:hypothetical protein